MFATRIKVLSVLERVHTVASVALTISALATGNFFGGNFYTYDDDSQGISYSMQAGLFGSCWDDNCDSSDPFYWWSVVNSTSGPPQFVGQWTALQTMLLSELGFRAIAWLLTKVREHAEKNHPRKTSWAINGTLLLAVLCGATTMGLLTSMPGTLVSSIGGTFWFNTSSILQICSFPIGTLGVFWHVLARWYINKQAKLTASEEDTNTSWLFGQQVAISVNGKTLMAQILPANQQPFLVIPDQSTNQPAAQPAAQPVAQPITQPLLQSTNHQSINQWPINQSINLPQAPQYIPNNAATYHQGQLYNNAGYVQSQAAYQFVPQSYQPLNM